MSPTHKSNVRETMASTRQTSGKGSASAVADRGSLKSMHKLMAILDCFSPFDRSLTLNEIAARCDMPKTTVHRLVSSLREVKLLEQDRERDRYRMGIRLFELGSIVMGNLDIYREARPLVERLIGATGEGSHLCVFDGTNMVSIEHREPNSASVNWTTTLSISPSYCTGVGKAALAFQEEPVIEKIIAAGLLPFTANTITDPQALALGSRGDARARILHRRRRTSAVGPLYRGPSTQRRGPCLRRRQRQRADGPGHAGTHPVPCASGHCHGEADFAAIGL